MIEPILRAVRDVGYEEPSPIQEKAIPPVLEGRDLIGCAQTGTGKTAAFGIPVLQRLSAEESEAWCPTRALILTPTRELALQICESFEAYGKYLPLKVTVVFGGVPQQPQEAALRHGVDILVATPGRLLDLVGQQLVDLQEIRMFVLDEADRMLDMGFLPDVRRVIGLLPKKRQTLLFSATMPDEIAQLAATILNDPTRVEVDPVSSTVDAIEQSVYFVGKENKRALLAMLMKQAGQKNALIFVRTKHGADKVARDLTRDGVRADSIHGDKTQTARQYALNGFKEGHTRALVATDIAARGIDIDDLSMVINYDMPSPAENYVHRIGRTGRAGRSGIAVSFCDSSEYPYLLDVEKLTAKRIPVVSDHPYALEQPSVGRKGKKVARVDRPEKETAEPAAQKPGRDRGRKNAEKSARTESPETLPVQEPKAATPTRPERAERPQRPERPERNRKQENADTLPPRQRMREKADAASVYVPDALSRRDVPQVNRGLPSIRSGRTTAFTGRQQITVDSNDQLPKPAEGHALLTSFADTGIDYYMTENPNADNEAIENLGYYVPPAGALRKIFGDEYDGHDIDFSLPPAPLPLEPTLEDSITRTLGRNKDRTDQPSRNVPPPKLQDTLGEEDEDEEPMEEKIPQKPKRRRPRRRPHHPAREDGAAAVGQEPVGNAGQPAPAPAQNADKSSSGEERPEGEHRRPRRRRRPSHGGNRPAAPSDDIRTRDEQPFYGGN